MRIIRYSSFCLLLLMILIPSVFGAGLAYDGLGVKARGMGGAFRAVADDWSAAYYNPAGYNRIADNSINGNLDVFHNRYTLTPNVALGDYFNTNGTEQYNEHEVLNIPQGSIQFRLPVFNETAFGLSIMQIHDQNQIWDLYYHDPAYNSTLPLSKQFVNDLDVVAFQLTAAKGFMEDRLSVGIGLSVLRGDLYFNDLVIRENPFGDGDDNINALNNQPYEVVPEYYSNDGNGWGFGYKIGFLYEATEKLDVALVVNGPSTIDLSGTSVFNFYLGENDETTLQQGTEGYYFFEGNVDKLTADFDATLDLPASVGVGFAYELNDKLTLALDAEYTFWSAFKGFDFNFSNFESDDTTTSFTNLNNMYMTDMTAPVNWDDGGRMMVGANYKLNNFAELRCGFGVDQTIVNSETATPQFMDLTTKYSYSVGAGFDIDYWTLGIAITYTHQADLTSANYSSDYDGDGLLDNIAGEYEADNYHTVLGISYRF